MLNTYPNRLLPRVVRFCLISAFRLFGLVAIILVISAEIQEIVRNIQGYAKAVHADDKTITNNTTAIPTISVSSSLSSLISTPTPPLASPTETATAEVVEATQLAKRFFSYAAQVSDPEVAVANTTEISQHPGYVYGTTVPDHAGGILFSVSDGVAGLRQHLTSSQTLFRFFNVLVLFFLLVSEISPPWPVVTNFYLRFFPPLSEDSSVGFLGAAMVWVATAVLSSE